MADLDLPDGFSMTAPGQAPLTPPDGFSPQQSYSSSVLPFNYDSSGRRTFDPLNAGLTGRLWSAISAPADAAEGKIMPSYGNPEATSRAMDFASFFSPQSVATRAGEVVPGAANAEVAPTAEQLKAAAGKGYDAARASGLEYSGDAIGQLARGLQSSLQSEQGIIEKTAPKTYAILDELANPPAGGNVNIPGIEAARRGLSSVTLEGGSEGLAARRAVRGIDDFMSSAGDNSIASPTFGPPTAEEVAATLKNARGNYAAAMRSNSLTGELDNATTGILERAENRAHASHSGTNIDNAIRQRVASFLQSPENVAGFSQPEIDALNSVVAGGNVQNAARRVGNLFGGGGGLGQLAAGFGGAYVGGHLVGGAEGGALGAMLPTAIGISAKGLENTLARRSLNNADNIVRMNSPLARALQTEGGLLQPAMGRNSAVMRSVLPGLLAPQQQQQPTGLLGPWLWS